MKSKSTSGYYAGRKEYRSFTSPTLMMGDSQDLNNPAYISFIQNNAVVPSDNMVNVRESMF